MISELIDLLGESPSRQVGLRRHWREVERLIGITLPDDYKWLVNNYGDAHIAGHLWLPHPAAPTGPPFGPRDLLTFIKEEVENWKAIREGYVCVPDRVLAAREDLVPWARHDWDGDLCLLLPPVDNSAAWEVGVALRQYPEIMVFRGGPVEFVLDFLAGQGPRGWPTNRPGWMSWDDARNYHGPDGEARPGS
ncbi:SMI1/KNR4 family protein [Streptomyces sp. YIM 98790]|uniref:SMI1/KNR4 family protein n=1 Tax=Streptomyces sp. YIM 98790 TaxID=2689077 RepID=UPI0014092E95|nr:SMI1/KNR4 family protein [Streptomyces sp. YIM 98790]